MSKWSNTILCSISPLVLFIFCESTVRIKHNIFPGSKQLSIFQLDEKCGWRASCNFRFQGLKKDAQGNVYYANISTDANGFRFFGDPKSKKVKILFIGDSYTHALEVSNDKTYYGIISQQLPVEVFAHGCGGYATLQEYMILDEYYDTIIPNIVILQFCSNDLIDNLFELEQLSTANNNGMRRPYLNADDTISYQNPQPISILDQSQMLNFIHKRINRLQAYFGDTIELHLVNNGKYHPLYLKSIQITERLLAKIKFRCSNACLIVFMVDGFKPCFDDLKEMLNRLKIDYIPDIPESLYLEEMKGITIRSDDNAHFNETGHLIIADKIIEYIKYQI